LTTKSQNGTCEHYFLVPVRPPPRARSRPPMMIYVTKLMQITTKLA